LFCGKYAIKKWGGVGEGFEGLFRRFVEVFLGIFEGAFGFPFFCVFRGKNFYSRHKYYW
jgi:hypothetical protein